jgi:hypothetical protein
MSRVRALLTLVALVPMARAAHAQPVDPYQPTQEPAPASPAREKAPAPPPTQGPASPPPTSGSDRSRPGRDTRAPSQGPSTGSPSQGPSTGPPSQGPITGPPSQGPSTGPPSQGPSTGPPSQGPSTESPSQGPGTAPGSPGSPGSPGPDAAAAPPRGPLDPYAMPPGQDRVLDERVSQALVARAQNLLDGRVFLDAKQLAVEALVRSPKGAAAEHARAIIHAVNRELGIPEDSPRAETVAPPAAKEDTDTSPIQDPTLPLPPVAAQPEGALPTRRIAATVHGALYAGLIGTTIGSFFSSETPAKGAVPLGLAFGAAGGALAPFAINKLGWTESQVRTVGAGTVWGGVLGGLFGDIAKLNGTTAREVLVAASAGSMLGGLGGYVLARDHKFTRGDVALVDTFAGMGAVGGLTIGMLMQPAESEAYSLNAVLGITGGVIAGYVAAPMTNTTPRRMLRVAGLAAAGGAAPFLLYAAIHTSSSTADERITGLLSSVGLVAGAWLGFRLTRGMDDGLDVPDGKAAEPDDAPVALVGRNSSGRWGFGGVGLTPLSPVLAPQHGLALQLVGATF